jgi:hypothetical protein
MMENNILLFCETLSRVRNDNNGKNMCGNKKGNKK